jgi:hypothetical protein
MHGRVLVGRYRLVLRSRPVDDHRLGQVPGPWQYKRRVSFPVGEAQSPIRERHGGVLVLDPKVPLALVWGFGILLFLAASRQLFMAAKNAWTQASAVWACSFFEVCQRMRCFGLSHRPLCRTVRQNEASVWL